MLGPSHRSALRSSPGVMDVASKYSLRYSVGRDSQMQDTSCGAAGPGPQWRCLTTDEVHVTIGTSAMPVLIADATTGPRRRTCRDQNRGTILRTEGSTQ